MVPDTLSATLIPGSGSDIKIDLEYVGEKVVDVFGEPTEAGTSSSFSYKKFFLPIDWQINYYAMDTFNPARYPGVFTNAIKQGVVKKDTATKLEFTWWGSPEKKMPEDHFALVATATRNFPKGNYTFGITADDGARFYVDGKLVMDAWSSLEYTYDDELHHEVTLSLEGVHQLEVEYYDQTGFATLMMDIQKE